MQYITASFQYHLWKREIIRSKQLRCFSIFTYYSNKLPQIRIPRDDIKQREFSISRRYQLTSPFDQHFSGRNIQFLRKEACSKLDVPLISMTSFSSDSFIHSDGNKDDLVVSIVGPPNAGKSTLFNRLMCKESNRSYRLSSEKKRHRRINSKSRLGNKNPSRYVGGAIVSSTPGTTRDRRECVGRIGGVKFKLLDTAGLDGEKIGHYIGGKKNDPVTRAMIEQTLEAARQSDLILLMFDAKIGVTSDFSHIARWLQKKSNKSKRLKKDQNEQDNSMHNVSEHLSNSSNAKVVILANKLEGDRWSHGDSFVLEHLEEVSRLGFGEAIPISAEHGDGLADLAIVIDQAIGRKEESISTNEDIHAHDDNGNIESMSAKSNKKPLQLAILGRQNVGKSTLVNALLKQSRVITGSTPGLTRDAIAIKWSWNSMPVQIVDTAGIRRISQRDYNNKIEDLSVQDAMRAMKTADVGVLVLDASAHKLERQELAIADAVIKEGRALVIAANKMDLVVDDQYSKENYETDVRGQVEARIPILRRTPVVPMCSLTGECVDDIMPVVFEARERWQRTISTGILNRWLREVIDTHPPPKDNGTSTKIKYIMQTKGRPPTFLLFCNTDDISKSYMRYLTRNFQDTFEMYGMEVRLAIKKSANNPFENKTKKSFSGIGGKDARKNRMVKHLKAFGTKMKKGRKRRHQAKK